EEAYQWKEDPPLRPLGLQLACLINGESPSKNHINGAREQGRLDRVVVGDRLHVDLIDLRSPKDVAVVGYDENVRAGAELLELVGAESDELGAPEGKVDEVRLVALGELRFEDVPGQGGCDSIAEELVRPN